MRLGALRRHWDRLGRSDPFWAVLTDPDKKRGGWDPEQFFRAGTEEIAAALERAERLGLPVARHRALDFGCGLGRLTQAMADHFERCDGVDISAAMLAEARRYDRHPGRCTYHLNVAPDLSLFADGSFNFVYTTLVLQHMEPRYSKRYIRELLRVLAPGGLLVFQLPSHRTAQPTPTIVALERTPIPGRLPEAAFRAHLASDQSSLEVHAEEQIAVGVTVDNRSPCPWAALPDAWGRHRINLANHWLDEDGELVQPDDARCPLPYDLAPGARADMTLRVTAPAFGGIYWLELDLVQENVCWFAEQGSQALRIRCRVTGGMPGPPPRRPVGEIAVMPEPEPGLPFRKRHPRVFHVLRVTGLREIYWAWRRALDRVKLRRDHLWAGLKKQAHDAVIPLINGWKGLANWWKRRPFGPIMEMHCVPRDEVVAILTAGGGRLVDTEVEVVPGGFHSCRYWVVKDAA